VRRSARRSEEESRSTYIVSTGGKILDFSNYQVYAERGL